MPHVTDEWTRRHGALADGNTTVVTKRGGRVEPYDRRKIGAAMRKALAEVGDGAAEDAGALEALLAAVETRLGADDAQDVESIQDLVERTLMERGHYDAAKAYILYRHRRSELRAARRAICELAFPCARDAATGEGGASFSPDGAEGMSRALDAVLDRVSREFDPATYPLSALAAKFSGFAKPSMGADGRADALVRAAVELTSAEAPEWSRIAGRLLALVAAWRLRRQERARGIDGLYGKLRYLTD